jgi:hypothetical protein
MMQHSLRWLVGLVLSWSFIGTARADEAPPDDYKDPCAAAGIKPNDPGCTRCMTPEFKDPTCPKKAAAAGLKETCRAWSYAMWCPADRAATQAPTAPIASTPISPAPASKGCGGGMAVGSVGFAVFALAALVAGRRGRRRR